MQHFFSMFIKYIPFDSNFNNLVLALLYLFIQKSIQRFWIVVLTVRIGAMLAYTPLDEKSLALLLSYLQDFLK